MAHGKATTHAKMAIVLKKKNKLKLSSCKDNLTLHVYNRVPNSAPTGARQVLPMSVQIQVQQPEGLVKGKSFFLSLRNGELQRTTPSSLSCVCFFILWMRKYVSHSQKCYIGYPWVCQPNVCAGCVFDL